MYGAMLPVDLLKAVDSQIKVEEFFDFFFSDDAAKFQELFHKKCGDRGAWISFSIVL